MNLNDSKKAVFLLCVGEKAALFKSAIRAWQRWAEGEIRTAKTEAALKTDIIRLVVKAVAAL